MKAPRKTVTRPIFRHNNLFDKELNEEKKEDIKLATPEMTNEYIDAFTTPTIEFDMQESFLSIEPQENFIDEVSINMIESFNEDIDFTDSKFEFYIPMEFDEIFWK